MNYGELWEPGKRNRRIGKRRVESATKKSTGNNEKERQTRKRIRKFVNRVTIR